MFLRGNQDVCLYKERNNMACMAIFRGAGQGTARPGGLPGSCYQDKLPVPNAACRDFLY